MLFENLIDTIGNTPMVKLTRLNRSKKVNLYAKLEGNNPTGSLKDRIVKYMVEAAEEEGRLKAGSTLLEPTSGNTGISLAMVSRIKGYKLKVVMPENVSKERRQFLEAFGAEFVLTDGEKGTNGAIEEAQRIAAERDDYVMLDQYANKNNPRAHYETTAREILNDVPQVDVFVSGLGTGGTLMGVGKRLREANPGVKIIAVQPYPQSGLQGLRNLSEGFVPPILDMKKLDGNTIVRDEEAFTMVKGLADEEGIFAGISAGAVVAVGMKVVGEMDEGNVVVVLADGGWKYLSEDIWTEAPEVVSRRFTGPLW
ncbi:MAG: PLP-dependent cysteine synthase family protein [Terriglobia bacterium]